MRRPKDIQTKVYGITKLIAELKSDKRSLRSLQYRNELDYFCLLCCLFSSADLVVLFIVPVLPNTHHYCA